MRRRRGREGKKRKEINELAQTLFHLSTVSEAASEQEEKVKAIVSYDSVYSNSCLYSYYKVKCLISVAHEAQLIWSFRAVDMSRALKYVSVATLTQLPPL